MIRIYKQEDWSHLQRIYDEARKKELTQCGLFHGFADLSTTYEREELFEGEVAVYLEEDEIRGFVAFTEQEITWLYVEPTYQRQGIGKKLLYFALQHTERPLSVWVLHGNVPAIMLYESLGFHLVEEKKGQLICPNQAAVTATGLRYVLQG